MKVTGGGISGNLDMKNNDITNVKKITAMPGRHLELSDTTPTRRNIYDITSLYGYEASDISLGANLIMDN